MKSASCSAREGHPESFFSLISCGTSPYHPTFLSLYFPYLGNCCMAMLLRKHPGKLSHFQGSPACQPQPVSPAGLGRPPQPARLCSYLPPLMVLSPVPPTTQPLALILPVCSVFFSPPAFTIVRSLLKLLRSHSFTHPFNKLRARHFAKCAAGIHLSY